MARFTLLALALASTILSPMSTVLAHPTNGPRNTKFGCGVEPTAEFLAAAKEMAAQEATSKSALGSLVADGGVSAAATINVNVYFHVVAKSNAASDGYVTAAQIDKQLTVMNDNYGKFVTYPPNPFACAFYHLPAFWSWFGFE